MKARCDELDNHLTEFVVGDNAMPNLQKLYLDSWSA